MNDNKLMLPFFLRRHSVLIANSLVFLALLVLVNMSIGRFRRPAVFALAILAIIPIITVASLWKKNSKNWLMPLSSVLNVLLVLPLSWYYFAGFMMLWPIEIALLFVAYWGISLTSARSCYLHWVA